MLDPEIWNILSDDTTRQVFREIAKERSIRLRDLADQFSRSRRSRVPAGENGSIQSELNRQPGPDREEIEKALRRLEDTNLIEKKSSAVGSLTTYYLTADGLKAKRKISRR